MHKKVSMIHKYQMYITYILLNYNDERMCKGMTKTLKNTSKLENNNKDT